MKKEEEVLLIFGKNVEKTRIEKGVSIEQLSSKTKIRKKYLEKIEKGLAKGLSTNQVFIIAQMLEIQNYKLFEGL